MEIRFKTLGYQKDSVQAIVDCFKGQPRSEGHRYMVDQGAKAKKASAQVDMLEETLDLQGEPYRVCRRPLFLRECPDEKSKIHP